MIFLGFDGGRKSLGKISVILFFLSKFTRSTDSDYICFLDELINVYLNEDETTFLTFSKFEQIRKDFYLGFVILIMGFFYQGDEFLI